MDWLMQMEVNFILFLQSLGTWLEIPMEGFTFLGNELFFLLVMPALYWSIDPKIGFRTAMMLILSVGLNTYVKILAHSPRPYWVDSRVQAYSSEVSFGLPSGHSQNSAAIWGMIAASIKKRWMLIISLIIIFFVGVSRMYLGVHFLRDVLLGWAIGGLIIFVYLKLETPVAGWLVKRTLWEQLLLAALFAAVLLGLGYLSRLLSIGWGLPEQWSTQAVAAGAEKPDPYSLGGIITIAGVAFGFTGGYALHRHKYGETRIANSGLKRLACYTLGLIGIVAIDFGLKIVFPEDPPLVEAVFRFIRYALIGLWVTYIAPLLFKAFKLDC